MNDLATSFLRQETSTDPKRLWRETSLAGERKLNRYVLVNIGRQQQAGKEDYVYAFSRHDPALETEHQALARHFRLLWRLLQLRRQPGLSRWYSSSGTIKFYGGDLRGAIWGRPEVMPEAKSPNVSSIDAFLAPALRLEAKGHIDSALDVLYDRVDDFLRAKRFAAMDSFLVRCDVDSLSVDILLGLLTATLPAKSKLPARSHFFTKVESTIKNRGEWELGLLTGLDS